MAPSPDDPSPPAREDARLVQRCQGGDFTAFDQLMVKYQPMVTGLLFRFSRDRGNLEDMVQETFLRAWRGLGSWKPDRPFQHWLKRVAVHVGLEFCRKHRRSPFSRLQETLTDDEAPTLDNIAGSEEEARVVREAGEEAHAILALLPPEDRALLTLLHLDRMPLAEIAEHFGWSLSNAKVKAFRARQKLRSILQRHGYSLDS